MPKYIDVGAINWYDDLFMKGVNNSGVWVRYKDVESLIRNAPAADVEPVRHGHYIGTEFDGYADGNPVYYEWKCSECDCVFEDDEPKYRYCPNCGAKMDKEACNLEETLKQKVSEAAEQLMKSISQETDAELQRDMIGSRIYYEDREAGERWLRMEAQKQESSAFTLRRHLKWDGDVLHATDTMHNVMREAKQAGEDAMTGEILDHFDCDLSDFREYMHDKTRWEQKQWAAMPHWIPVTERLPEEKGCEYLVVYDGRVTVKPFGRTDFFTRDTEWGLIPITKGVKYWMPLPEPPKEADV